MRRHRQDRARRRCCGTSALGVIGFVGVLSVTLVGCQVPTRPNSSLAPQGGHNVNTAKRLEEQARRTHKPGLRSRHYLNAAEAYLSIGSQDSGKRCIDKAREAAGRTSPLPHRAYGLLGQYHIARGEVVIAERYLTKWLPSAEGPERETTLARLSMCARSRGDDRSADRFLARLRTPFSPAAQAILDEPIQVRMPAISSSYRDSLLRRTQPQVRRPAPPRPQRTIPSSNLTTFSRHKWNARPARGSKTAMGRISRITIHHTAGPNFWGHDRRAVAEEIRKIQRFHQRQQRWADIGYHFLIDRTGAIWQGRELKFQGAHAKNQNPGNIGIALLGNYTRQDLTESQRRALRTFVATLMRRYNVSIGNVYTHGEIAGGSTACPGPKITRFVRELRYQLRNDTTVAVADRRRRR
ncbi:MAG: peptidoglycan recognition family protein [Planctomycetota bacterium]